MSEVSILRASLRDAWALSRLDRRCFMPNDRYGWLTYAALSLWPRVVLLKAMAGKRMVGVVAGDPRRDHALIVTLGVDPDWRGRGLGKQLMRACEGRFDLPRYRLQVRQGNVPAIRLYQKLGYTILDSLPGYYGDGEGAYLMEKERG